uniref:protein PXR1-like n=1 Tax=Erigeron canadensis TaxID=72917 RepID=UPI001CB8B248|nr:protein PXR1-like [Erigeron canadensis]
MKIISGTIVSSKPVNLSKAANILSKFVKSDNGASQAVSAYLRRASEAFNEHVYFKKNHKLKRSRSKEEASTISGFSDMTHRDIEEDERTVMENGDAGNREFDQDPVEIDENGASKAKGKLRKKDKKKKTSEDLESSKTYNTEVGLENVIEPVKEKSEEKKKKKKRKNSEVDGGEIRNSVTPEKKKRRKTKAEE